MKEFTRFHPIVNFMYFAFVIALSCVFMHPVCIGISLICGFVYSLILSGARQVRSALLLALPVILLSAIINPLFNHRGVTILSYFQSGNPLTLESIVYGAASGLMLGSGMLHFINCTSIMTSDKIIYLFGRITPVFSLLLSMILRFIPKFRTQLRSAFDSQRGACSNKSIYKRIRYGTRALSAAVSLSLEDAVETADSMKARGYGLRGRTAYSNFRFDLRDAITLAVIMCSGIFVILSMVMGSAKYRYFPSIIIEMSDLSSLCFFAAYFIICAIPIFIELLEGRKWKY